ncbi:hypothetical protein ZIOFF_021038 [Zingiber officinale]|uniref:PUB domain-containing protein n=1 Tax=Zingiber officinale TaxID=94328 RepID=A0A8J5H989_ZINOF|nr:hypothetical protein ZIOFF_021038 [Zingiber officinale]
MAALRRHNKLEEICRGGFHSASSFLSSISTSFAHVPTDGANVAVGKICRLLDLTKLSLMVRKEEKTEANKPALTPEEVKMKAQELRINLWPKYISSARKLQFISSVLQGVECFWLAALSLPFAVIDRIYAVCHNFMWTSKHPPIYWAKICKPKEEGGCGLRDFKGWNKALLSKERIRIGKELLEAKRIEEENERKRFIYLSWFSSLSVMEALEMSVCPALPAGMDFQMQAERRRKLGLPPENPETAKPSTAQVEDKKSSLPVKPATKAEYMRDCLRALKQHHKDEDARVKRSFQTLLAYVGNVAKNPDEEKFRKIRLNNPTFQDRVGSLHGGIDFLGLCGFEKLQDGEFLFLPRDKVDMAILNTAGSELNSAIANPFFGVL